MSNVTKQEETSHSTKRRNDKVSVRNKTNNSYLSVYAMDQVELIGNTERQRQ
jgi:hypothetical protein